MGMYSLIIYILNCIAVYYYTLFLGAGVGTGRVAVCFDSHPLMPRFPFSSPHTCIVEYGGGARPSAHASFSRAKANHITTSSATTHAAADFPVVLVAAVLVLCWCSLLFLQPAL